MSSLANTMDAELFRRFSEIAYEKAGISLALGKESMVAVRVGKRLRALGMSSEYEYLEYLEADETGTELVSFLDVISTNYTRFFREPDHFDALAASMREWVGAGQRVFKLWCAASSTGEEPYSIAIMLLERFPTIEFKLLATDISTRVLKLASEGVYETKAIEGLARGQLGRFFTRSSRSETATYKVKRELRERISFRRLNLATPPYPMAGPFDVIFCRNVMIYFDQIVRQRLTLEVERLLRPGGMFAIGHSETLTGVRCGLNRIDASVFIKSHEPHHRRGKDVRR